MNPITEYSINKSELNSTAYLILVQVIVAIVGFLTLMAVFAFPDILRESSQVRLSLFLENQHIIVPTYFLLAMTGLTQAILSVMLYRLFANKSLIVTLAALFGVLCGIFQVIGFIRWPILIPYLAETAQSGTISADMVAFVEGAFNRYAGMAIGEHLGFLMQGFWTLFMGIAMFKEKLFNKVLAWPAVIIGLLTLLVCLEPLAPLFSIFGELTNPVISAWYIWLVVLAVSLLRSQINQSNAPNFGLITLVISIISWAGFVVPAYL